MKKAIELKSVVKRYDDKFQLGEISLDIPSGIIVGLIGIMAFFICSYIGIALLLLIIIFILPP